MIDADKIIIGILLLTNFTIFFLYLRHQKKIRARKESIELSEFMLDLLHGDGLVKVSRVNPSDVMLRSPRGR